jgi:hypothetical protein
MRVLNWFLHGFHVGLILFTAIGWVFPSLRSLHLAVCFLTLFSWFGIGLAIGRPGFCLVTELHFRVRRRLRLQSRRESYLVFLTRQIGCHERSAGGLFEAAESDRRSLSAASQRPPTAGPAGVEILAQGVLYAVTVVSAALVLFC